MEQKSILRVFGGKVTILLCRKAATQTVCDFCVQVKLFLKKEEEISFVSNCIAARIRVGCSAMQAFCATPEETIIETGFSRFIKVTQLLGSYVPVRVSKAFREEEM